METIHIRQVIQEDGRFLIEGLPLRAGETVEVTAEVTPTSRNGKRKTNKHLLQSDAIGMWADRDDIPDSPEYSRQLRK